jgi:uncharacterized membrane protein YkoI
MKQTASPLIFTRHLLARILFAAGLLVLPALLAHGPMTAWAAAFADDDEDDKVYIDADDDHETARKALEQHEILPLGKVLALIQQQFQGDVIEVELEMDSRNGIWIYDLELIDGDGRVREFDVDARTGEVLKVEYEE